MIYILFLGLGVLVVSFSLIYDTQLILIGKQHENAKVKSEKNSLMPQTKIYTSSIA